jgi:hypothetical protein
MMITVDSDDINGVDWELPGDPAVNLPAKGRLTTPDGTVVHGYDERSVVLATSPTPDRGSR